MKAIFWAGVGTLFPFAMTVLGAALVFLFRDSRNGKTEQVCMGFAAGVMSAAAVFSMLIPAVEQTRQSGGVPWQMATLGFALGAMMIAGVDAWMRRMKSMQTVEDDARRRTLMYTAITLHNIPEGMAVGLAFALAGTEGGLPAAAALALGIGVQNLPEGAAVALPLRQGGMSRKKSFWLGAAPGVVEPIFGMLAALVAASARMWMPGMMAFCAGAMMWVVFAEMIPDAAQGRAGVLGAMGGYALMMALDIALG